MITFNDLQKLSTIDDVLTALFKAAPERVKTAAHDALLVDYLFPTIDDFDRSIVIPEDKLEVFKDSFEYKKFGVPLEVKDKVKSMKNIDRVIDALLAEMPLDKQRELAFEHVKRLWFRENSKGDLKHFIENLKPEFWGISRES